MASQTREDGNLVTLLRAGGKLRQAAVTQLFERYALEFKRYFRRHGATDEQAADLLQDTFVKIVQSADSFEGTGSLEAWLWAIARNTLMSEFRTRKPDVALDALEPEQADGIVTSFGDAGTNPAVADCVKRSFDAFARRYAEFAEVLIRVVVDGWEYAELATFRACSYGAAREYLSQCRKHLADFVAPCLEIAEGR
jgi:RNA polymerase sigma-70 factor (ECF subfamily)